MLYIKKQVIQLVKTTCIQEIRENEKNQVLQQAFSAAKHALQSMHQICQ